MSETNIAKQIKRCEELYEKKQTLRRVFLLSQRYFVSYVLTGDISLLHKASFFVSTELEKHSWCFDLYFFKIYIKLALSEAGDKTELRNAVSMLEKIKGYKNNFRKTNPDHYLLYMYFSVLFQDGGKKSKIWSEINVFEQEQNPSNTSVMRNIWFLKATALYDEGYPFFKRYLEKSLYEKPNEMSAFFFITLAGAIEEIAVKDSVSGDEAVKKIVDARLDSCILLFLRWCVSHGYEASKIVDRLQSLIAAKLAGDIGLASIIYNAYPNNEILQSLCTNLMLNKDYSEKAFYYYKEAESKQMLLPKLYEFVVLSAYKNKIEDLSRFSLDSFLVPGMLDTECKPFIYHVLLTNEKSVDLVKKYLNEITSFGIFCLENNLIGRYYNSIYRFLLDTEHENMEKLIDIKRIDKILQNQMFLFEVTVDNPHVKHIFIYEKEKNEKQFYEFDNGTALIRAASDKFSYMLFGKSKKTVIEGKIRIKGLVENADINLFMRYFKQGSTNPDLLIVLSKYYINFEKPPVECLEVFSKAVTNNSISKQFRIQISAALGNYYLVNRDYDKSVSYYKAVDENLLSDKQIEQMLLAYINAKEYEKAVNLIIKKSDCISDRNLFFAVRQILLQKKYEKDVADIAYELILKSWYDKSLIDTVLKYYNGSQDEWQEFSQALSVMSVSEHSLDEIILKNAVWMHKLDRGAQTVFARMFESDNTDNKNKLINDFAMYCAYEMIINNVKPEYATIDALERLFLQDGEPIIAYALVHVYLNHDITTFNSDIIIKMAISNCEKENILFPIFKKIKDKSMITPYIEKNQPLIYKSFPDKSVLLYYSIEKDNYAASLNFSESETINSDNINSDNSDSYRFIKMKYLRFGLYLGHITHFYGEKITYFFSEEMPTGSISSKEQTIENNKFHVLDNANDPFYVINNALIFEQVFKYSRVEEIITKKLKDFPHVKGWIL